MDPNKSKIDILARLVQLYQQMDKLAPNILVAEWTRFLGDLEKERGPWDEAFKKTQVSPDIADRMRIDIAEKVNLAQQQIKPTPKQKPAPQ